jgi:hypothetical protein
MLLQMAINVSIELLPTEKCLSTLFTGVHLYHHLNILY